MLEALVVFGFVVTAIIAGTIKVAEYLFRVEREKIQKGIQGGLQKIDRAFEYKGKRRINAVLDLIP